MSPYLGNAVVLISILVLVPISLTKRLRTSELWQATVTPLASIIGSGFLISAPLIVLTTGKWAALAMLGVVAIAYFLGHVMRFNIRHLEPLLTSGNPATSEVRLEYFAKAMLGIAYVISVAFYLKLLSIFVLQGFGIKHPVAENIVTTMVLAFIGVLGWMRGLQVLEILEKYAVDSKLIIIVTMIIGNAFYNIDSLAEGTWFLAEHDNESPFRSFQKLLGMLIIIQGFETSRYLVREYSADVRIQSMRYAQLISGSVYVLFVGSAMILFNDIHHVSETAVIELCRQVAPILPVLLVFAAIMSQFSASIADTIGSSGLISEATRNFVSLRQGIVVTVLFAIALTWMTDIFEVVVVASKAFAFYYLIQCLISAKLAYSKRLYSRLGVFLPLAFLMLLVIALSIPVE